MKQIGFVYAVCKSIKTTKLVQDRSSSAMLEEHGSSRSTRSSRLARLARQSRMCRVESSQVEFEPKCIRMSVSIIATSRIQINWKFFAIICCWNTAAVVTFKRHRWHTTNSYITHVKLMSLAAWSKFCVVEVCNMRLVDSASSVKSNRYVVYSLVLNEQCMDKDQAVSFCWDIDTCFVAVSFYFKLACYIINCVNLYSTISCLNSWIKGRWILMMTNALIWTVEPFQHIELNGWQSRFLLTVFYRFKLKYYWLSAEKLREHLIELQT